MLNHETIAILKLQGSARRLLEVTNTAISGKEVGENAEIDANTAHALNDIAEEITTLVLESVPRPADNDPNADLLKALEKSRVQYTKRKAHLKDKDAPDMPAIDDLNLIVTAYINASVVLQYLLDNALSARLDGETPLDALTDKEKESVNFALCQVVKTAKPFKRLIGDTE